MVSVGVIKQFLVRVKPVEEEFPLTLALAGRLVAGDCISGTGHYAIGVERHKQEVGLKSSFNHGIHADEPVPLYQEVIRLGLPVVVTGDHKAPNENGHEQIFCGKYWNSHSAFHKYLTTNKVLTLNKSKY